MGWRVWGKKISEASQKVRFNSNFILRAARPWVIVYGDTDFDSLSLEIYADDGGAPGALIATSSNVLKKSEIITAANGVKECYFEFNQPINGVGWCHFVLSAYGYTETEESHLAWKKAFPDPAYPTGVDTDPIALERCPYALTFIAGAA